MAKGKVVDEETFVKRMLKKIPKKRRKKAKILYELAKKGYFLRVGEDLDNKEMLKAGEAYYNGQIS